VLVLSVLLLILDERLFAEAELLVHMFCEDNDTVLANEDKVDEGGMTGDVLEEGIVVTGIDVSFVEIRVVVPLEVLCKSRDHVVCECEDQKVEVEDPSLAELVVDTLEDDKVDFG
jgi:hypothetical protein